MTNNTMWEFYYTEIFQAILTKLEIDVCTLAEQNPDSYGTHPKAKLLKKVYNAITEIPKNPTSSAYFLGLTLGAKYAAWRRVKDGLPDRYRLFFRFHSVEQSIIYAWLNDERTLRKQGSRTDAYLVFRKLLSSGKIDHDYHALKSNAISVLPP